MAGRKVHVVAWRYQNGGGFDWYWEPQFADQQFEAEKSTAEDFRDEDWTAYRFDVAVGEEMSPQQITEYIDDNLDEYLQTAARFKAE